jgi:hypothetical protein
MVAVGRFHPSRDRHPRRRPDRGYGHTISQPKTEGAAIKSRLRWPGRVAIGVGVVVSVATYFTGNLLVFAAEIIVMLLLVAVFLRFEREVSVESIVTTEGSATVLFLDHDGEAQDAIKPSLIKTFAVTAADGAVATCSLGLRLQDGACSLDGVPLTLRRVSRFVEAIGPSGDVLLRLSREWQGWRPFLRIVDGAGAVVWWKPDAFEAGSREAVPGAQSALSLAMALSGIGTHMRNPLLRALDGF